MKKALTLTGLLYGICLFENSIIRLVLTVQEFSSLDHPVLDILLIFTMGWLRDSIFFGYLLIPWLFYFSLLPQRMAMSKTGRGLTAFFVFLMILVFTFQADAEWFFWQEFNSRFNFVAVDYLVYTHEVWGNIVESYPMVWIGLSVVLMSVVITALVWNPLQRYLSDAFRDPPGGPWRVLLSAFTIPLFFFNFFVLDGEGFQVSHNRIADQLARNGAHELFAAFRNNRLDYQQFYKTIDNEAAFEFLRKDFGKGPDSWKRSPQGEYYHPVVHSSGKTKHNVILIMVESLSAEYLGAFGNTFNLTPNLDALAGKSLLFTRFYATGNRTVRGLEAINLSLPPTPGYSVVKRPNNEHLFSLGELFKSQGYLLKFIYGGFGYFDNMNYFFENNGFTSIDRSDFAGNEIDFANIWGVSDASLLAKALQEADLSYATGQPFFNYVLTTSNHRPYTYPDGKIDIPSGTGRWGGVKYTDFAIGQFLEKARRKPWFDDTLFVIVADHCAGGRGRTDLPINNYHIPMLIYAPKLIPPGIMDTLSSQVDVAPTLAGMLGFSYASKFLGKDILRMKKSEGRAFIATYQNLGYYVDGRLVHLAPKEKSEVFQVDDRNHSHLLPTSAPRALQPAISYYQFASILLDHHLYGFPVNF